MTSFVPIKLGPDELITKPGLYDVSIVRYHSGKLCDGPNVTSSPLRRLFTRSPAHSRVKQDDTDALRVGRGTHHVILGEADFSAHFVVQPKVYVNEKGEEKLWHNGAGVCKVWNAEHVGHTILTEAELLQINGMAYALSEHPLVKAGILNGQIERTLAYKDVKTGLWVLARPDVIPNDSGDVADLKTCTDVSWRALESALGEYRYDMQAAIVRMAMREVLNLEMTSFALVFVEKKPPHCVEVIEVPLFDLDEAEKDVRTSLDQYAKCLETGLWPGPGGTQTDAVLIPMPDWARKRAEARRTFLEAEIAA